ncbi:class I SAM-dependent methyltransferase [Heyndrickxia oleronia]|uniref:SAM-dependent methyltransferase n=1 Tax=Heyndrickxia oleronia TaxID=38875 RepID=A0A8E2I4C5_9BACI|nr:class I SAM-dependent methyltransferase [Heyndrickxia oleronia]MEC1375276.1 class I SAM-dependent methyltransferase [Heyndrickxia oleronia]OOP65913.1 SAM-dependent methyltransferase [Heyndrickxia oleronia]QQZ03045.1 class I SAM-dependent methyltransferase [Heyndrickxia oleronia]
MDNKSDVQKQFGSTARSYVTSEIHQKGKDLQLLLAISEITGEENLLDIATGGGHTANLFAPHVKHVTALDLTQPMLQEAEKFIKGNGHKNVEFVQGDAEQLPFSDQTFDIVTCRIAPHHFPNIEKFIYEAYRVLKNEGYFLLDDNVTPESDEQDQFYNTVEKLRDYSHFRAWKKTEWLKMLELQGFLVEELYRFEKTFEFDSWCNRMKLSKTSKDEITNLMLNSSQETKKRFHIKIKGQSILSFKGEAIIIKARKAF